MQCSAVGGFFYWVVGISLIRILTIQKIVIFRGESTGLGGLPLPVGKTLIGVFKNFAILTGKHQCRSLFLIKLQAWRSAALLKMRLHYCCFSVNITKFLRTAFCMEHLQWLPLKIVEEFLRNSNLIRVFLCRRIFKKFLFIYVLAWERFV